MTNLRERSPGTGDEALTGIRIVELALLAPAPLATLILEDFSAHVTLLERPEGGEPSWAGDEPLFVGGKDREQLDPRISFLIVIGIRLALRASEHTGHGQVVDVVMTDSVATPLSRVLELDRRGILDERLVMHSADQLPPCCEIDVISWFRDRVPS